MFVDNDIYADIYEPTHERGEQAAAASIEAVFTTLGASDLASRQDPVSFDKFKETPVGWLNRILGVDISTHRLAVRTPVEYVAITMGIFKNTWHTGKFSFVLSNTELLTGRLGYIAETSPWLRFLMSYMYTAIARA